MHAYFMTRGIQEDIDKWKMFMQSRWFDLPVITAKGEKTNFKFQSQLRPIEMWEWIFPEEQKDLALTTLKFDLPIMPDTLKMKSGILAFRKMLGASKIPKFETNSIMLMPTLNIHIIPIGVKYDMKDHKHKNGLTHEFL